MGDLIGSVLAVVVLSLLVYKLLFDPFVDKMERDVNKVYEGQTVTNKYGVVTTRPQPNFHGGH